MASNANPPSTAIGKVFHLTEVLERILLHLPMRDLLFSQRVCRLWRDLALRSVPLRRALFVHPVKCANISFIDWRLDDRDFYPELELGEHIRGPERDRTKPPERYTSHWGRSRKDNAHRIFVNPLLAQIFPVLTKTGVFDKNEMSQLPESVRYRYASWRGMSPCQPFVDFLAIEADDKDGAIMLRTVMPKLKTSKGIMMGNIYESLLRWDIAGPFVWIKGSEHFEEWSEAVNLRF